MSYKLFGTYHVAHIAAYYANRRLRQYSEHYYNDHKRNVCLCGGSWDHAMPEYDVTLS